ncbi:NEDD4-binding protein 2 [Chanos chanos]|uniref:NEDD4-binding protein 2 n=1 Tax=Chanos chanos TaxID=29144 RepID=A0A6J2WL47_CHACN|nr:NEDD4-binding protein 2 [Chanos chanos]
MPRKKKNGQSPARVSGQPSEFGSGSDGRAYGTEVESRGDLRRLNNFGSSQSTAASFQGKEEIVKSMQEMFSHLDPDVIYIVLSEADFKVENAMDSLLELSGAAEGIDLSNTPSLSGFEMAAALLSTNPPQASQPITTSESSSVSTPPPDEDLSPDMALTEEYDTLIDQELANITSKQALPSASSHPPTSPPIPLSSLPLPSASLPLPSLPPPQTALPELLRSSVEGSPKPGSTAERLSCSSPKSGEASGGYSPVNELSFGGVHLPQNKPGPLDFSHLTESSTAPKPYPEVGGPGRPSAFQAYRRQTEHNVQGGGDAGVPGGALQTEHSKAQGMPPMSWNLEASEFQPRQKGPTFITPVMLNPSAWSGQPTSAWFTHGPFRQAPLKPSATIPKSWAVPPPQARLRVEGKLLVLLRGAPGSGKSTLARAILEQNPEGVILSTDDYFCRNGPYHYEPSLLGEAHEWNHLRAKEAFENGKTPVIIDNTNMQCWEMKPYVAMALKHKYKVLFREPDTWWKTKPRELERRTKHGVTKEKIRRMLERYDRHVTIQMIMESEPRPQEPARTDMNSTPSEGNPAQQSLPFDLCQPDLVGNSGSALSSANPCANLSSSLPDVSSVGQAGSAWSAANEADAHSSKDCHSTLENLPERVEMSPTELLDGEALDQELDACLQAKKEKNLSSGMTGESGEWERERVLEQPVAFSESIAQRVRRERERGRGTTGQPLKFEPSDDFVNQEDEGGEAVVDDGKGTRPELLDFIGDWPSESLKQRGQRVRRSGNRTGKKWVNEHHEEENADNNDDGTGGGGDPLDLLQGGDDSHLLRGCSPILCQDTAEDHSSTVDREGYHSLENEAQSGLPDCVLDQRAAETTDSPRVTSPCSTETHLNPGEDGENAGGLVDEGRDIQTPETGKTNEESSVTVEKGGESCSSMGATFSSGGLVESESSHIGEVARERRKGQSRRSGKACRLALTFTNQSCSLPHPQIESPQASPQLADLKPVLSVSETSVTGSSAQTDPQDFALMWRIEQQNDHKPESDSFCHAVVVLEGNPARFIPKQLVPAAESSSQKDVPYRVVHDKGSQVEEKDLIAVQSRQQSLELLRRHFKYVSMDMLEDLYEKCHHDMEWTINLLLDSGERFYRDEDEGDKDKENLESPDLNAEAQMAEESVDSRILTETEAGLDVEQAESSVLSSNHVSVTDNSGAALDILGSSLETDPSRPAEVVEEEGQTTDESGHGDVERSLEAERLDGQNPDAKLPVQTQPNLLTGESQTFPDSPGPRPTEPEPEPEPGENLGGKQEVTSETQGNGIGQHFWESAEGWREEGQRRDGNGEKEENEELDDDIQAYLAQIEEMKEMERKKSGQGKGRSKPLDIRTLELKLPTELALQLIELFGPVGINPGELSPDDCAVRMDLNFARLVHQKLRDTIQEKHRQEALSYHLLQESSVHWGESQTARHEPRDLAARFLIGADGYTSLASQSDISEDTPFMDHWNASRPPVSLRDIMTEELVLQESMEKSRLSRWDLDRKDGAAMLKEKQLFSLFPTIDRHFLKDIFRDHNYSLEQTEQFLRSLLDESPVKNVVATESLPQNNDIHRTPSRERRKVKDCEVEPPQFQDTEDPEYEDFRTEAMLHRRKQQECFEKAAEAYRQGRKDVASFYSDQGRLHGEKMREANHRAAVQIFERVNKSLLPQNVLDLHGLHVDEALFHLEQVLTDKTVEWKQGLCRPQLSIITGRGNRSQGGVARIRPAVLDYLNKNQYRYSEPKTGLVLVSLH